MTTCRICAHTAAHARFEAREMMFGWRDGFAYFECAACGCLQIEQVPHDLERYYPGDYWATSARGPQASARVPSWCWTMLTGPALPLLSIMTHLTDPDSERHLVARVAAFYFDGLAIGRESRILDVGCGPGGLLQALQRAGYRNLRGVDRYVGESLEHAGGVRVVKGALRELEARPEWDLIMLHHSFEHVDNPLATLRDVAARLAPGGTCLVRIPVVPNHAWREYGVDWAGLDAPRHLFLHSRRSLEIVAAAAGLGIDRVVYDSTNFQFLASERYARGEPLVCASAPDPGAWMLPRGRDGGPGARLVDLVLLERRARSLDARHDGDQAAFYLSHRP